MSAKQLSIAPGLEIGIELSSQIPLCAGSLSASGLHRFGAVHAVPTAEWYVQPHAVMTAEFICAVACVSTAEFTCAATCCSNCWVHMFSHMCPNCYKLICAAALLCQRQCIFLVSYHLCLTLFLPLLPQWSGSLGRRGYSTPLTFGAEHSAVSCCLHIWPVVSFCVNNYLLQVESPFIRLMHRYYEKPVGVGFYVPLAR